MCFIGSVPIMILSSHSYGIDNDTSIISNGSFINSSDRVLIVAPHPDDEAIGAGGVIRYCVEHKIPVEVVVMTDGDTGNGIAVERHNESVNAMNVLGLNSENITFLGYRDGSLPSLLNQNWNYNKPYHAHGMINNTNYPFSYQKNASFCGANVALNLEDIICNFKPTIILYPDSEDEQIDHWATNAFVDYAAAQTGYTGAEYNYIIHDPPAWPSPYYYDPSLSLNPPPELAELGYKWVEFPLTHKEERLKEVAFDSYTSQIGPDSYIRSFIRTNEIFAVQKPVNITISNYTTNYFSNSNYPDDVVKEPEKNSFGKESIRSRELVAVGFQMDQNDTWVSLRTRNNVSNDENYQIHIVSLDMNNPERIDILINNGKAYYQKYSQNSYYNDELELQTRTNGIVLKIPSSAFKNMNSFMINADVIKGYPMVDWTGTCKIKITR